MAAPDVETFVISDELCRRSGISFAWLPINQLGVFPTQKVKAVNKDVPSSFASDNASSVYQVRQDVALFHPILRRLVNEASGIFLNVQTAMNHKAVRDVELLQYSIQYRSVIRATLENLRDEVMRTKGSEKEQLQNYVTIFYSVECIWHLCEILYVENIPGNAVIRNLMDWVRFHFPRYERKAATLLTGDLTGIESHPDYWDTVLGCLMQGRVEIARALLSLHTHAQNSPFKLVEQVLKSIPTYDIYEGISMSEYNLRWRHWQVDTQSKIDAKLFISETQLNLMMRLVIGEEEAWGEIQDRFEAWYELLAAWLFYTEPTVKSYELGQFAHRCVSRMRTHTNHLDRVLLAAMEGDIEVIKEIQDMTENGWFVTHLTDLLFHAGQLDKWQTDETASVKLHESFLIDYGTLLMGHHSLWQVGLNYLDHCPTSGLHIINLLLPRVRLGTEAKTNKIIKEAHKRDLFHIVQSICKIRGMQSKHIGRVGNGLVWALKSQDANFTSHLADHFLQEYSKTGILQNCDLLDNLGSCMLATDRLIFLGKYYEFQRLYKAKCYKESGSALISLISSKFTPKHFWHTLLTDALSLVECDELVLSSNDTFHLLNCVEENANLPKMKDKLSIIRLGIARNLSRALTYEAQLS